MAGLSKVLTTIVKRGRKSRRGRGLGSTAEKEEAKKLKITVKQLRERKKSAKRMKKTTVETPPRTPIAIEGGPTGYPVERLAALRTMPKGPERGEIGRLLRQSEQTRRAEQFPAPPERGRRTAQIAPEGTTIEGQAVEGGINTRLRSLHRPDYKQVHDQAVAHLKREFPGKSEAWYDRKAIELIEREFPRFERGQEYIAGTPRQVKGMMGGREQAYLPEEVAQVTGGGGGMEAQLQDLVSQFQAGRRRKRGGIVRRRKGGAIGVGAALRGYGKGYKKGGKI
jgi:hypothetical protein